jgi:hypothetical protein
MVTNRGFDVAPFTTISELGSKAHAHLVFTRPLCCPSDNQRRRSMTVIWGASTAGTSTQPAQAWQRASLEGWMARLRGDRARVNVAPVDAEDAEAGLRLRAANFRQGRGSDKRPASTPTDACQGPRRVRREAEADGLLVDEMSRVILNGYRCAWSRCAECFGKQSTSRRRSAQSPSISIYVLPTYNCVSSASTWPFGSM